MARFEVQGPDGSRYEVTMPDGMEPGELSKAIDEHFAKLGITSKRVEAPAAPPVPAAPAPKFGGLDFTKPAAEVRAGIQALPQDQRKDAFNEWAKVYVANERKGGGVMQNVRDIGRNIARGTPVGSWLDEANAGTQALMQRLGLGGSSYDEAIAYQRATDEAIDRDSTKLGTLPLVGDVTAGGVQKLVGGVASAPFSPMVNAVRGTTMLPRVVNSAATGMVYGGAYGAGEGEGGERIGNAAVGATIGGGLGAAAPLVATGVARLLSRNAQPQGALAGMDRRAVESVADDMVADRVPQVSPVGMRPEAMIADLGPNLQGHTGAIARMPGEGQTVVKDALGTTVGQGRRGGAPDRIRADVDATLGPPRNLVQLERDTVRQANEAARPYYREFEQMQIPETPEVTRLLMRVRGAPGVMQEAQRLMQMEGIQPPQGEWWIRTGLEWDYVRRAVDDIAKDAPQYSNARRVAENLSRDINQAIDDAIRDPNGVSVYQQARMISGQGQQFRQGIEQGQEAFSRGTHPDQMAADLAAMQGRPMQRAGFDAGARGQIRDIMGEASSALGPTGDTAIRKQLGSDYAQQKLAQVIGENAASRILGRLDAEGIYEQTRQAAVGNSVTAAMQQNLKRYNARTDATAGVPSGDTLFGAVKNATLKIVNKMTAGFLDERSRRQALDAAQILVAQGQTRDQFIRELTSYIRRRDLTVRQRAAGQTLLESVFAGARAPAIEGAATTAE